MSHTPMIHNPPYDSLSEKYSCIFTNKKKSKQIFEKPGNCRKSYKILEILEKPKTFQKFLENPKKS